MNEIWGLTMYRYFVSLKITAALQASRTLMVTQYPFLKRNRSDCESELWKANLMPCLTASWRPNLHTSKLCFKDFEFQIFVFNEVSSVSPSNLSQLQGKAYGPFACVDAADGSVLRGQAVIAGKGRKH